MNEFNNFGVLIRNRRQKLGLDIRSLSKISNTDQGGISRIENGRTSILIDTAIKLCTALDITPEEIYHLYNKGTSSLQGIRTPSKRMNMLNITDTRIFVYLMLHDPNYAWKELIKITLPFFKEDIKNIFPLSIIKNNFSLGSDINSKLNSLFKDNLAIYPENIDNKIIIEILKNDGVISIKDIGAFIRNIRHHKSISLAALQEISHISDTTLCKIENATIRNIRLSEILMLDHVLRTGGVIFELCWNSIEYNSIIGGPTNRKITNLRKLSREQMNIVYIPICIYRWLQIQNDSSDIKWLIELRKIVRTKKGGK